MDKSGNDFNKEIDAMIEKIAQTKSSEEFKRWMEFLKCGHAYSFGNFLWIIAQRPDATLVRSFNAWRNDKELGRYVVKGAKGIKVLYPKIWQRKFDANGNRIAFGDKKTPVASTEFGGISYGVGYVFDVSDTDGKPLPEMKWYADIENDTVFEQLLGVARDNGIQVEIVAQIDGHARARGVSKKGKIELVSRSVSTFIHEIAHELLHQNADDKTNRHQREIEAEMVSYIICQKYGIEGVADASATYLANWGADGKSIRQSTSRIISAVNKISDGIEGKKQTEIPE